MKTNKFKLMGLLMCFAAMMVTSCSSDESYATRLVGTWACLSNTDKEVVHYSGNDGFGPERYDTIIEEDHLKGKTVSFLENGTIQTNNHDLLGGENGCSWAVLEGQLYIKGDRSVWNIKKLTKTELKIETEQDLHLYNYAVDNPDCHYTRVFKRQ